MNSHKKVKFLAGWNELNKKFELEILRNLFFSTHKHIKFNLILLAYSSEVCKFAFAKKTLRILIH